MSKWKIMALTLVILAMVVAVLGYYPIKDRQAARQRLTGKVGIIAKEYDHQSVPERFADIWSGRNPWPSTALDCWAAGRPDPKHDLEWRYDPCIVRPSLDVLRAISEDQEFVVVEIANWDGNRYALIPRVQFARMVRLHDEEAAATERFLREEQQRDEARKQQLANQEFRIKDLLLP